MQNIFVRMTIDYMVEAPQTDQRTPELLLLCEQVDSSTEDLLGEVSDNWQEIHYRVPTSLVEMWTTQPLRERLLENISYKLFIDAKLEQVDQTAVEVRRYRLSTDFKADPLGNGSYLQWDWILVLRDNNDPDLSCYEWTNYFSNDGNSGGRNAHLYRKTTIEDVEAFSRFLVGAQPSAETA